MTRAELRDAVLRRLGDAAETIWTGEEVDSYLQIGYRELAQTSRVFPDVTYPENFPRGFSYTAPWEKTYGHVTAAGFDYGCANYTYSDERRMLEELQRIGPGNHTSLFEFVDGHLENAGADTSIPATADLPAAVTEIDRVTWDNRTIDALVPSRLERSDTRYEVTEGEVYGYLWRKDGVRTLRKVRVPAAAADSYAIHDTWGILRSPTDISGDTVTGTWGLPRRIPTMHPMGAESFGLARRPYQEGTNVRVEHWRQGRALDADTAVCELPDRYAIYLRDYVQGRCLSRQGPGQDVALGAHFLERWTRGLTRIQRRLSRTDRERVGRMGGETPSGGRPPRPKLPWNFGSVVR
jgi:hypothetical protein